ncbi:c-type cytochrome [Anderseniella sp. Alg231-50]|uniref:c-type cytochrome n=1 Tax=Anderseniella sp. Alg231-50 TaxID=1922226 RepID=UPI00307B8ED6
MTRCTKLAVFAAIFAIPTLALAHSGATGIVKKRMEVMKDVGAVMKELGAMVKGDANFDASTVARRAGDLKVHAAGMPALFPEGSIHGPSEALPQIWADFEEFSRIASDLESAAATLSGVTEAAALPAALGAAGKTCKACHSDYRKP